MNSLNKKYLNELFDHIRIRFKKVTSFEGLEKNSFLLIDVLNSNGVNLAEWFVVLNDDLLHPDHFKLPQDFSNLLRNLYDVLTIYYGFKNDIFNLFNLLDEITLSKDNGMEELQERLINFFPETSKVNIYHIDDEDVYLQVLNYTQLIIREEE